jgi:hypothetical protein
MTGELKAASQEEVLAKERAEEKLQAEMQLKNNADAAEQGILISFQCLLTFLGYKTSRSF